MFQPDSLFKKEDNSPGDYPMFDKTHIYQCALYWIDNNQDASIAVDWYFMFIAHHCREVVFWVPKSTFPFFGKYSDPRKSSRFSGNSETPMTTLWQTNIAKEMFLMFNRKYIFKGFIFEENPHISSMGTLPKKRTAKTLKIGQAAKWNFIFRPEVHELERQFPPMKT